MRHMIGFALVAMLLGGCAVYALPVPYGGPPAVGVVVAPAPVVVAPVAPWGWHAGWHGGWRHHG